MAAQLSSTVRISPCPSPPFMEEAPRWAPTNSNPILKTFGALCEPQREGPTSEASSLEETKANSIPAPGIHE